MLEVAPFANTQVFALWFKKWKALAAESHIYGNKVSVCRKQRASPWVRGLVARLGAPTPAGLLRGDGKGVVVSHGQRGLCGGGWA